MKKKRLSRFITIVCFGVLLYAGSGLVPIVTDYYQNWKVAQDAQATYHQAAFAEKETPQEDTNTPPIIRSQFDGLLEKNEDVVGWISIDDTNIDYPIVQSQNNMDYLTQDFNKNKSMGGSIFMDYRNDVLSFERNMIVYGHRMKDGSMFQHLTRFLDEDFFKNHQTFEINTLYNSYEAQIFAVYQTTTEFNYIQTDFSDNQEFKELLTNIRSKSEYELDIEVGEDDRILTLSTCDYEMHKTEGRMVVQAKLVEK